MSPDATKQNLTCYMLAVFDCTVAVMRNDGTNIESFLNNHFFPMPTVDVTLN